MIYDPAPVRVCLKCGEVYPMTSQYFRYRFRKQRGKHYWSRICRKCDAEYNRQWRLDNLDRARERERRWRQEHPERVRERKRSYYRDSPREREQQKARSRRYAERRPERTREARRRWRLKNIDKARKNSREWQRENPARARQNQKRWVATNRARVRDNQRRWWRAHPEAYLRRHSREKQLPYTFTRSDWQRCLNYFDHRCAYCGKPRGLFHTIAMDHWIPVASADCPGTVPGNILPACQGLDGCNNSKSNQNPHEWLAKRFGQRRAAEILERIGAYFDSINGDNEEQ